MKAKWKNSGRLKVVSPDSRELWDTVLKLSHCILSYLPLPLSLCAWLPERFQPCLYSLVFIKKQMRQWWIINKTSSSISLDLLQVPGRSLKRAESIRMETSSESTSWRELTGCSLTGTTGKYPADWLRSDKI